MNVGGMEDKEDREDLDQVCWPNCCEVCEVWWGGLHCNTRVFSLGFGGVVRQPSWKMAACH